MSADPPRAVGWVVSRWWDDPWTRGAWSLLRVGGSAESRRRLGEPIGDRVILAGEATSTSDAGMVHGAADEGRRAAAWCVREEHRKVIVVGAGAAGLAAARALHDEFVDVVVVEARDRIGGRVQSVDLHGVTVELGANWLQQGERNSLRPVAHELGLRLVETDFGSPTVFGPDGPVTDLGGDEAITDELRRRVEAFDGPDRSLGELVDEWLADPAPFSVEQVSRVIDAEVFLDAGASLHELSAKSGFEPGVGDGDQWVVGGYARILEALAESVLVLLEWPAERIEATGSQVTVRGPAGHLEADAAIVTIPVPVLQSGAVTFDPPLPETHRGALELMTTGRVEKVALRFEQRWWQPSPSGYLRLHGDRRGDVCEWLDTNDVHGHPVIVGLFVGDWVCEMWDGHTDAEVARAATRVLAAAAAPLSEFR